MLGPPCPRHCPTLPSRRGGPRDGVTAVRTVAWQHGPVRYFVRRDATGSPEALLRMATTLPEYLGPDGTWHADAGLVRYFVGDDAAEEIDEATARQTAEVLGGSL